MTISSRRLKGATWLVGGVVFFGSVLDAISNAYSLIGLREAIALTLVVSTVLVTLQVIARRKGIQILDGHGIVNITRLNRQVWGYSAGVVALLWVPSLMQFAGLGPASDRPGLRIASVKIISVGGRSGLDVRTINGSAMPAIIDAIRLKVTKYTVDAQRSGTSPVLTFGAAYELLVDIASPSLTERQAAYSLNPASADRFLVTIGATNAKRLTIAGVPQEHLSQQARDARATSSTVGLIPSTIHIESAVLQLLLSDGTILEGALEPFDVSVDGHGPTLSADPVWMIERPRATAPGGERGDVAADRLKLLAAADDWSSAITSEVQKALRHPLPGVRIAAAEALAARGDRLAADYLKKLVFSADEPVWHRIEAVRSLIRARVAGPQDLLKTLSSKSLPVGGEVIRAITYYRVREAEQALIRRFAERDEVGRQSVLLYGIGRDTQEEMLAIVTAHEAEEIAIALGCIAGPQATGELKKALADTLAVREASGEFVSAVEDALAAIARASPSALGAQTSYVRRSTRRPRSREQLCTAWKEQELVRTREREDEAVLVGTTNGSMRKMPWVRDTTENALDGVITRWAKTHKEIALLHQHSLGEEDRQRALFAPPENDEVVAVVGRAEVVEEARAQARATLPSAIARFVRGLPPGYRFLVTFPLGTRPVEHVFMLVERIEGHRVHGILATKPAANPEYALGQHLEVSLERVEDWTILDPAGVEEGNYVGKALEALRGSPSAGASPRDPDSERVHPPR